MKLLFNIIKSQFKEKRSKLFLPMIIYSMLGICVEVIYTAIASCQILLMGHTSLWMFGTYAIGFTLINVLNDVERYYKLPMILQTFVGGFIIILVELISGLIIIKLFGIQAWNYEHEFLNLWGCICLKSYLLFTISIPLGIWIVDTVDWLLYRNPNNTNYPIWKNYKDLITLK